MQTQGRSLLLVFDEYCCLPVFMFNVRESLLSLVSVHFFFYYLLVDKFITMLSSWSEACPFINVFLFVFMRLNFLLEILQFKWYVLFSYEDCLIL